MGGFWGDLVGDDRRDGLEGGGPPPRSHFDSAQHERPCTGEGRHETCPYGGWGHLHTTPGDGFRLGGRNDGGDWGLADAGEDGGAGAFGAGVAGGSVEGAPGATSSRAAGGDLGQA